MTVTDLDITNTFHQSPGTVLYLGFTVLVAQMTPIRATLTAKKNLARHIYFGGGGGGGGGR